MRASVAVAVAALAAAVGAGAAILVVSAADLGDSTTTVVEAAPAPATPNTPVRSAPAAGTFDPGSALRGPRGRRRHHLCEPRRGRLGAGLRLRGRPDRRDPHERTRHHERRRAPARLGGTGPRRERGLRRVLRRRARQGEDRRLGPLQRRRRDPGDAGRPCAHAAPARRLPRSGRGRAGCRDRKPVREADVPLRRRRLRHRPLDRLAHLGFHGRERRSRPTRPSTGGTPAARSSTATAA